MPRWRGHGLHTGVLMYTYERREAEAAAKALNRLKETRARVI